LILFRSLFRSFSNQEISGQDLANFKLEIGLTFGFNFWYFDCFFEWNFICIWEF